MSLYNLSRLCCCRRRGARRRRAAVFRFALKFVVHFFLRGSSVKIIQLFDFKSLDKLSDLIVGLQEGSVIFCYVLYAKQNHHNSHVLNFVCTHLFRLQEWNWCRSAITSNSGFRQSWLLETSKWTHTPPALKLLWVCFELKNFIFIVVFFSDGPCLAHSFL